MSTMIDSTEAANMLEGNLTGEQPQTQTEVTPQQQAQSAAPVEEQLYEVKINGQTHKVPLSELTGGYSRTQDYTRKTTEIAEYRRQIDAEVSQYRQQIQEVQEFFRDPRVQQALAQLQAGVQDPNQPLTAAQVQQMQAAQAQQIQAAQEQRMQQMAQELEIKTLAAGFTREIDTTIAQIKERHPVLQDIEGFDMILRQKVAERNPQSLEETKRLFAEIAQGAATKLESRFQQQQKQAAVTQQQLRTNGIEPPGGTTVPLPPTPKLKIGSADLLQAAVADMVAGSQK